MEMDLKIKIDALFPPKCSVSAELLCLWIEEMRKKGYYSLKGEKKETAFCFVNKSPMDKKGQMTLLYIERLNGIAYSKRPTSL